MRDLSLERHPPMREQIYQSTINYSAYGRAKPTLPPQVPTEYYGTISNRFSSGMCLLIWSLLSNEGIVLNRRRIDVMTLSPFPTDSQRRITSIIIKNLSTSSMTFFFNGAHAIMTSAVIIFRKNQG